ncbi:DUF1311 domain-containing protein [Altererythrobacter sp. BO-6]|uniref:lysozyme inhibitor LprI family protein n=1 Tax=Altererythrobacter sp. BO-6 TaxID=2604537 RepID=UPI0013E1955C|nr:lysozyme inhibitor LprI family protein [Altererythrobacter sp. BO-6]QIG54542.1 DUF1311 domain-containing protein [Altererythrobacter sp. BO-6]
MRNPAMIVAAAVSVALSPQAVQAQAPASGSGRTAEFHACMKRAGGVTADMLICLRSEYGRQDRELNRVYREVRGKLRTTILRNRLLHSQRAWIWRRDYDCQLKVDGSGAKGGTAGDLIYEDCRVTMVTNRIAWLKKVPKNPGYLKRV